MSELPLRKKPKARTDNKLLLGRVLELQETQVSSLSALPQQSTGLLPVLGDSWASLLPRRLLLICKSHPVLASKGTWSFDVSPSQLTSWPPDFGLYLAPQNFFPNPRAKLPLVFQNSLT